MRYLRYFLRLVFSSQVGSEPPLPLCNYLVFMVCAWLIFLDVVAAIGYYLGLGLGSHDF